MKISQPHILNARTTVQFKTIYFNDTQGFAKLFKTGISQIMQFLDQ